MIWRENVYGDFNQQFVKYTASISNLQVWDKIQIQSWRNISILSKNAERSTYY